MRPCIIINTKSYPQALGSKAVRLAKICSAVRRQHGADIHFCPPTTELGRVASAVRLPLWCQHTDAVAAGAHTGWVGAESVKASGAVGSLINHSEHRLSLADIKTAIKSLRVQRLKTLVCVPTLGWLEKARRLRPDLIAYEPPALIGGEISVSEARPGVISDAVKKAGKIPLLVGAGVQSEHDVRVALQLGAHGVLVASHVVKARSPKKALLRLVRGLH